MLCHLVAAVDVVNVVGAIDVIVDVDVDLLL